MTNKKLQSKTLLNKTGFHTVAAISVDLSTDIGTDYLKDKNRKKIYIDGEVAISDCNRSISLNFDWYNSKEKVNALRKLDILIKRFTEVRDFIESVEVGKIVKK